MKDLTKQQENMIKALDNPAMQNMLAALAMKHLSGGGEPTPEQTQAAELASNIATQLGGQPPVETETTEAGNQAAASAYGDWMARQNRCYTSQALAWVDSLPVT